MRMREPGRICDRLWFLGRPESCVYLLEGDDQSMLVSGGMSYIVPDLIRQFGQFNIEESRIKTLLILHAHFDHVGAIPFLKRRLPALGLYASVRAWQLLEQPRVLETINDFGRDVAKMNRMERLYEEYDLEWRGNITGKSVSEGDRIPLGGLNVRIFETPGHSSCAISAYVPEIKALFASDAGGIPYGDTIIASGNSNYTQYQQSLEKLRDLDVRYACADHYGYIVGNEAKRFIKDTITEARERRQSVEEIYRRTGDIDATVEEMLDAFFEQNPDYMLTPEITRGIYRQMVRHIAGAMEEDRRV